MVLVTGVYMETGEFKVQEMGLPPPESREKSRYAGEKALGAANFTIYRHSITFRTANKLVDFFGGPTTEISVRRGR